jgi:hypothetical protein
MPTETAALAACGAADNMPVDGWPAWVAPETTTALAVLAAKSAAAMNRGRCVTSFMVSLYRRPDRVTRVFG